MKTIYKHFTLIIGLSIAVLLVKNTQAQNIGIGTASPQEKMDVNGAIRIGNTAANNAGTIKYISGQQKFQVNIAGSWYDVATGNLAYITNLGYDPVTNILSITEGSITRTVNLTDLQDNTDNQTLNLSSNTLSIAGGNSVSLAQYVNTDNQTLSITGNNLAISGGNSVSLAPYLDNTDAQQLSYNATTNILTLQNGGTVNLTDLQDNTDNQTLSLASNTLSITGGNSVSLAPYSQTLSLAANNLSISGGNSVNLSSYLDNTDAQTLSLAANTLSISGGNNVSLASYVNTDNQTLSLSGNTLSISGGNGVNLSSYLDNTDAQTLSLSGNNLSIAGGNTISLASFANTDNQTLANVYGQAGNNVQLTAANGDVRFYRGASTEVFTLKESNAYVGMGTSNPLTNLNVVNNNESITQSNFTTGVSDAGILISTQYTNNAYTPGIFWHTSNESPTMPKAGIYLQMNTLGTKMIFGTSTTYASGLTQNEVVIDDLGNVGIGSATPSRKLDVAGDINFTGPLRVNGVSGTSGQVLTSNGAGAPSWTSVGSVTSVGLSMPNIFTVTNSPVTTSGTLTTSLATQSANRVFAGPASGGAAAPTFRTLVLADLPAGTALGNGATNYVARWTSSSDLSIGKIYDNGTNVGIGTSNPQANLHLRDAVPNFRIESTSSGQSSLNVNSPGLELTATSMNATSKYTPMIKFGSTDPQFTTENPKFPAGIVGRATETYGADTDGGMSIDFFTSPNDAGTSIIPVATMTLSNNGNLGIGTTSPAQSLHTKGSIRMDVTSGSSDGNIVYSNPYQTNEDWKLAYRFDFENGTQGWVGNTTTTGTTTATLTNSGRNAVSGGMGAGNYILTNCCASGNTRNTVFKRSIDLTNIAHSEVMIRVTYYYIDSWDGGNERGWFGIAPSQASVPTLMWSQLHDAGWNFDTNWHGSSSYADISLTADGQIRNSSNIFWLFVGSNLGDNPSDESFGVDNVEVWVR